MTRRMSCSMTVEAVRDRTKTVTRRDALTWRHLKPGDRLTLVEKAMGLPKGAKQVVLAEVEIIDVRVEPITLLSSDVRYGRQELAAEGFEGADPVEWVAWWLRSHGYSWALHADGALMAGESKRVLCRRIEWRYLDNAREPRPHEPRRPRA